MKHGWLLLVACFGLVLPARAQNHSATENIRSGRAAFLAEKPELAKSEFESALSHADIGPDDRFAALVGLGRAEIWMGEYVSAVAAFREALELARSEADKTTASTGLARALNADEYYREAYSLAAPYASTSPESAVEVLRAERALGWEDRSAATIAGVRADEIQGRLRADFLNLKSDLDFASSNRADGTFSFSRDSDGLTIMGSGLGAWIPGAPGGNAFESLRMAANAWTIDDPTTSDTLTSVMIGSHLRIGDTQHADIALGEGSARNWDFFIGNADWDYRFDDRYGVTASVDRSPIFTTAAVANRVLNTTYAVGGSVRPSDHWNIYIAYNHQDFTDDNHRNGASLRIVLSPFDLSGTNSALGAQILARVFHSSLPSTGFYFDPADYHQAQFDLIGIHRFNADWLLRAVAGGGYQSVDGSTAPSYDIQISLAGRLPGNGRAELRFERNSFASLAGGGSGYWVDTVSASLAYPLGL